MGFENSIIKFKFYEIINKNDSTKNLENILGPGFIWAHGQNVVDMHRRRRGSGLARSSPDTRHLRCMTTMPTTPTTDAHDAYVGSYLARSPILAPAQQYRIRAT